MQLSKYILRKPPVRAVLCYLAALYIRFVHMTGNWRIEGDAVANQFREEGRPFVLAFWHGRLLMMSCAWRHKSDVNMLISSHPDGRFVARTMGHFGVPSIVGSTTRGGWSATRKIVKLLRNGGIAGITPDGPQGPRMRVSDGVITIARMANAPILPLAYSASRCKVLSTWDRFMLPLTYAASRRKVFSTWDRFVLPLPFAQGVFLWGAPVLVPKDADEATREVKRLELEKALLALTERADRLVGQSTIEPAPPTDPSVQPDGASDTSSTEASETPASAAAGVQQ